MAGSPILNSLDATSFHHCPQRALSCDTWFSLCRRSSPREVEWAAVQASSWGACRLLCVGLQGGSVWPPQVLKVWCRSLQWVLWSNFCFFGVCTQSLYYHKHCCAFSNSSKSLSLLGLVEVGAPLQLVSIDSGWQTTPVVTGAWNVVC